MNKEEIVEKLEELTKEEINEDIFSRADELNNEYIKACEIRNHELMDKFIEEGGNASDFVAPKDTLDSRFNELIHILTDREKKFKKLLKEEVAAKLALKRHILAEIEKLVDSNTNIGKAYKEFKELQTKWTEAGHVPERDYKHLQSEYHRHVHNFYYNMKLSRDLRELDFKRNLEFREALLNKIDSLLSLESIRGVERMLRLYRMEWDDMGPTALDTIEPLRTRYRELTGRVLQRIREFYQERQKKELEHLEVKKVLLDRLQKISEENFDTPKQWSNMTTTVNNILEEWKKTGYAPKNVNEKIWLDFRSALQTFHRKKKEFFNNKKTENKGIKEKKKQLIAEAEAIANAKLESWDQATESIIALQKQWKEAGYAEHSEEERLWKKFREVCNKFFDAKRDSFKERDAEQVKNLELKEELIKRIEAFLPSGDNSTDLEALKSFSNEWKEIQHVPYKEKERIFNKYKKALDSKYESLKIDSSQRHLLKFKNSVDMLAQNEKSSGLLRKEEQMLKERIGKLKATVAQYENNLGFFAKAKGMETLLKDAQDNLNKSKEEVVLLEKKLKMLREAKQQQPSS
jgi:hypothetical protein